MPAGPTTETSRTRDSRSVAWKRSLSCRSSSARPTNGASRASVRLRPPRSAMTRVARQAATGAPLPLSVSSPIGSNAIARDAARNVLSPTITVPGSAAPWRRAAVFTESPTIMPSPSAPTRTTASPVSTPARALMLSARTSSTSSRAARTARSASSSRATGAPHTAITASPMNFSMTPPWRSTALRAISKYLSRVSRTSSESRDSVNGVNPTMSAKSTDTRRRSVRSVSAAGVVVGASAPAVSGKRLPQVPQNRELPMRAAPQTAQASPKGVPQLMQNATPSGLAVPQTRQFIEAPAIVWA